MRAGVRVGRQLIIKVMMAGGDGLVGVNLGKNKTSTDEVKDYVQGLSFSVIDFILILFLNN